MAIAEHWDAVLAFKDCWKAYTWAVAGKDTPMAKDSLRKEDVIFIPMD